MCLYVMHRQLNASLRSASFVDVLFLHLKKEVMFSPMCVCLSVAEVTSRKVINFYNL